MCYIDRAIVAAPPNKSLHWLPAVSVTAIAKAIAAPDTGASELNRYAAKWPSPGVAPEMAYKGLLLANTVEKLRYSEATKLPGLRRSEMLMQILIQYRQGEDD
jgi:hypothetical protein